MSQQVGGSWSEGGSAHSSVGESAGELHKWIQLGLLGERCDCAVALDRHV